MISERTLHAAVFLSFAILAGAVVPAYAQAGASGATPTVPAKPVPKEDPEKDAKPPASIIHPGNPDPGIAITPPKTGTMQVVPPPGSPGGNPALIPK
jgi:hypothetical protein